LDGLLDLLAGEESEERVEVFEVDGEDGFDVALESIQEGRLAGEEGAETLLDGAPGLSVSGLAQLVVVGLVDDEVALAVRDGMVGDKLPAAIEELNGLGSDEDGERLGDVVGRDGVTVAEDGDGAVGGDEPLFDAGGQEVGGRERSEHGQFALPAVHGPLAGGPVDAVVAGQVAAGRREDGCGGRRRAVRLGWRR